MVLVIPETDEEEEKLPIHAKRIKSKAQLGDISGFIANVRERLLKDSNSKSLLRIKVHHCHRNCVHNKRNSSICTCDLHLSAPEELTENNEDSQDIFCTEKCISWRPKHKSSCCIYKEYYEDDTCLCSQKLQVNPFHQSIRNISNSSIIDRPQKLAEKSVCEVVKENLTVVIDTLGESEKDRRVRRSISSGLCENVYKRKLIEVDFEFHHQLDWVEKRPRTTRRRPTILRDGVRLRKRRHCENQEIKSRAVCDENFNSIEVIEVVPKKRNRTQRKVLQTFDNFYDQEMSISDYKRQIRTDAIAEVAGGYVKTSTSDDMSSTNAPNHFLHTNSSSMATLSNIGNSCYLNSVIYTLRFAPLFLHNLHHLVSDLNQLNQRLGFRYKSSSLGRNVGGLQGSSGRSLSSKDLASLSINSNSSEVSKSNRQIVTEKLHELFHNLHRNELIDADPFHPVHFLNAIQDVSSTFEGNQQQDAHELLMCILDSIRETCQSLTKIISDCPDIVLNGCGSVPEQIETTPPQSTTINSTQTFKALLNNLTRKSKRKDDKSKLIKPPESPSRDNLINDALDSTNAKNKGKVSDEESQEQREKLDEKIKMMGLDFFCEDFEGITVSTTKCLTCETETEQKETMIDISVPISGQETMETMENPQLFFQNSCITKEYFRGENKYRCEKCFGYTEAIRSISFEVLPRLLVIQLKRFSGGMEKINSYIPTPFTLQCFCRKCYALAESKKIHVYKLYSVITHVGATLSAGHYITYTCSLDTYSEYVNCDKEKRRLMQSQQEQHQQAAAAAGVEKSNGGLSSLEKMVMKKKNSWLRKTDNRSKASSSTDLAKNLKAMNGNSVVATANSITPNGAAEGGATTCPGLNCCGIHAKGNVLVNSNGNNNYNNGSLEFSNSTALSDQQASSASALEAVPEVNVNGAVRPTSLGPPGGLGSSASGFQEPIWFMCDDDKIKSMPQQEFKELLSPNRKVMITPYLLFYARNDIK
ncbi:ubiquitin carboxyl-terminal hydrolase 1 [Phlebotomus argentipes]|uniref:ubiquitin carboxyl-terminal hydrolase 1 n=1 Tax=Phlebotomus argentipes TaxID=94469 RepID=UPI002893588C|nr:ubiquitin carboxyl-terminal hydrolase 1 [Phlebotomus argentipes]XP_059612072.1 ubiquitin carboxyl-terminal hydrolase 1 [Phlebotomus argentipes]